MKTMCVSVQQGQIYGSDTPGITGNDPEILLAGPLIKLSNTTRGQISE